MLHGPSLVLLWPNQMIFPAGPNHTSPGRPQGKLGVGRDSPNPGGPNSPLPASAHPAGPRSSPGWAKVFTRLGRGLHPAGPDLLYPDGPDLVSPGWAGVCIPEGRVPETRLDRESHPASINRSLPNQPGTASTDRSLALLPSDPRAGSDR